MSTNPGKCTPSQRVQRSRTTLDLNSVGQRRGVQSAEQLPAGCEGPNHSGCANRIVAGQTTIAARRARPATVMAR
jgi:hypothetical protein